MSFSPEQVKKLESKLDSANVKSRTVGYGKVSYIDGWYVQSKANEIFGFDGWSSDVVEMRHVAEFETKLGKDQAPGWSVSYICRIRVTVLAGGSVVTREDFGAGHGKDRDIGSAHESACKEAVTDALKRAMKSFGPVMGLALYDKDQRDVEDVAAEEARVKVLAEEKAKVAAAWAKWISEYKTALDGKTGAEIDAAQKANKGDIAKLKAFDAALFADLKDAVTEARQKAAEIDPSEDGATPDTDERPTRASRAEPPRRVA